MRLRVEHPVLDAHNVYSRLRTDATPSAGPAVIDRSAP